MSMLTFLAILLFAVALIFFAVVTSRSLLSVVDELVLVRKRRDKSQEGVVPPPGPGESFETDPVKLRKELAAIHEFNRQLIQQREYLDRKVEMLNETCMVGIGEQDRLTARVATLTADLDHARELHEELRGELTRLRGLVDATVATRLETK